MFSKTDMTSSKSYGLCQYICFCKGWGSVGPQSFTNELKKSWFHIECYDVWAPGNILKTYYVCILLVWRHTLPNYFITYYIIAHKLTKICSHHIFVSLWAITIKMGQNENIRTHYYQPSRNSKYSTSQNQSPLAKSVY